MLFNSFEFLVFFIWVTVLYFAFPHKYRWIHLLIASCIFYMYFIPVYIFILFFTIIIDYIAGIMIAKSTGSRRKMFLVMSLVGNIGVLAIFKYCNFLISNINPLFHSLNLQTTLPLLKIVLPIGLSFHTFQAMSYTIEVYRGSYPAEKHFGIYALYVMFYPQLVAGPIERPNAILPQMHTKMNFNWERVKSGLLLILWGLFKKAVVADRLAIYVNEVYNNPNDYHGWVLVIATIFFSFQIYCDFSGYSDIALGTARVMGFDLMLNFNTPYFSQSISEFWRRWHISLSTWFRDYLYIPLGGNRVGFIRRNFNLFFVFLVSGLWHGANWTYVIWGALHGVYLIFGQLLFGKNKQPKETSYWAVAFNLISTYVLVCIAWVFFRARNVEEAFLVLKGMFSFSSYHMAQLSPYAIPVAKMTVYATDVLLGWVLIFALLFMEFFRAKINLMARPLVVRWAVYLSAIVLIFMIGVFKSTEFIYFQF